MDALPPDRSGTTTSRLDRIIDTALAERRIVGAVVLAAKDGEIVYRRAAGLADREAGRPMQENAIFRLSSVTKPIVAATSLALVERGAFGLDTEIASILPEFRPSLPDGSVAPITIRHLLTHTAGLSYRFAQPEDGPYAKAGVSDGLGEPGLTLSENLRRIASVPLQSAPGTAWAYSVALDVLGGVIEAATGKLLQTVVADLVTGPLDMHDTAFTVTDRARLAVPYDNATPEPVRMGAHHVVPYEHMKIGYAPDRIFDQNSFPSGGGGMAGTAPDILTFLETIRTGGGKILRPETAAEAMRDQIAGLPILRPGLGWGLLSSVLRDPKAAETPQSPGTLAWGGVYGHSWFIDPAARLTVVTLTNTAIAGMTGDVPNAIRDALYQSA